MQPLTNGLKLLPCHLSAQPKQFGSATMPLALNPALLIVVIAVFQMPLGISCAACHCTNRQHEPTLTLFEIALQAVQRISVFPARWYS